MIRRVYEVDPLLCRCGERMRVVGFITQALVIRKILGHIGWRFDPLKLPGRPPPMSEDDFCPDPFPDFPIHPSHLNARPEGSALLT